MSRDLDIDDAVAPHPLAKTELAALRDELAAMRPDAARYRRLLKGPYPFCFEGIMCHSAADVSKAIDAALIDEHLERTP